MASLLRVVAFASLVNLIATCELAAQVKVSSKGCEIEFPAEPTSKVMGESEQFSLRRDDNRAGLLFTVTTLPVSVDTLDEKAVKAFFDDLIARLETSQKAKLLSEKSTKFDAKYPMRDVTFDFRADSVFSGKIYRMRIIRSGRTLYQVSVVGSEEYQASEEVKKFTSSLKLDK